MSAAGMLTTALATQIAEAVAKDETSEAGGCDISAGLFGPHLSAVIREVASQLAGEKPIDMVLHCPKCGLQHIDAPGEHREIRGGELCVDQWDNPPHRSHLCREEDGGCGHIWRPADVPTNGVKEVKTKGKDDSPTYVIPANGFDLRLGTNMEVAFQNYFRNGTCQLTLKRKPRGGA